MSCIKKLDQVKIISIDLFRTLVDVDQMVESVWRTFMGERYDSRLAKQYWDHATEILMEKFEEAAADLKRFKNCRKIFEETYAQVFQEINLNFNPQKAAEVLIENHKKYHLFPDTRNFLDTLGHKIPVCLASDCDIEMISGVDDLFLFDHIFISEILRSYKLNPIFFKHIIGHYQVEPQHIMHIGDSKQDIICPAQLGMITCWINRRNETWSAPIRPDFTVNSLSEILNLLPLE